MWKQMTLKWAAKLIPNLQKYRYVWIILLAGLLILYIGAPRDAPVTDEKAEDVALNSSDFSLTAFENTLREKLSLIEGAGQVELLLSMEDTEEMVYASNTRQSTNGGDVSSYENDLTVLSDGSYGEQPVKVKSVCPTFRGAVILCEGGDNTQVRWAITQAVSAACGLSTDKITVLKMQPNQERKGW